MSNAMDADSGSAGVRTLLWHRGAMRVPLEGFQPWVLVGFKPLLRFDQALWTVGATVTRAVARHQRLHLESADASVRTDAQVMTHLQPLLRQAMSAPGNAFNTCLADESWQGRGHDALREAAQRSGLMNVLCLSNATPGVDAAQCMLLSRADAQDRFTAAEARRFEELAPHAMQAFETCRALSLAGAAAHSRDGWATGIVDRAGIVHEEDAGFMSALKIEWPDWQGHRLPAPLLAVMACRNSAHWQHLCSRITVEFSAVDDLFLMAVRVRSADDALSDRERSVADRYAAGATYREIAAALQLSPATVRTYLRNVFVKLGVNNKAQIAGRLR